MEKSYFGTVQVSKMMKMLASTAVRLSQFVIQTIGNIMNSEHPYLCIGETDFEVHGALKTKEAMSWVDCLVYCGFARFQSLYESTVLINPKSDLGKPTQVNTRFRVQQLIKINGFRTVQHTDLSAKFKAPIEALNEEAKFLRYIGDSSWPNGMETIRNNLLQSMKLDKEVA